MKQIMKRFTTFAIQDFFTNFPHLTTMNDLSINWMLNEFDFCCYHVHQLFKTRCFVYCLRFLNFVQQLSFHSRYQQLLFHSKHIAIKIYFTLTSLREFMQALECFGLWLVMLVYFLLVIDGVISSLSSMVIFTFLLFEIFCLSWLVKIMGLIQLALLLFAFVFLDLFTHFVFYFTPFTLYFVVFTVFNQFY